MIARYRPNFGLLELLSAWRFSAGRGAATHDAETLLKAHFGLDHVELCPSGRGALRLILRALPAPFNEGRIVIPAYTCSAVVEAAKLAGREVLAVEHAPGQINLSAADLQGILRHGDVVIATHQYGYPCDIASIVAVAQAAGAVVVEDIAAALGATVHGRPVGTFGLASFGSFDASKLLHVPPKGGFIVTRDASIAALLKLQAKTDLSPFSTLDKTRVLLAAAMLVLATHPAIYRLFYALNFRLRRRLTAEDGCISTQPNNYYCKAFGDWQAAILLPQLRDLRAVLKRRTAVHQAYRQGVNETIRFKVEVMSVEQPGAVIRFPLYAKGNKAELHRALIRHGVDTGFSFTTIVAQPEAYNAWSIAGSVLNLPSSSRMTDREVERVVHAVRMVAAAP